MRLIGWLVVIVVIGLIAANLSDPDQSTPVPSGVRNSGPVAQTLYVSADVVNVREGPSTDARVLDTVEQGHELVKISESGEWTEVGVARRGGLTGWIHQSLISEDYQGGATTAAPSQAFDNFEAAFWELSRRVQNQAGVQFFTDVENLGDGIVQVTATDAWLSGPREDQDSNVQTLLSMWAAAEDSGLPIAIRVVDQSGNPVMMMDR